ncbi:DNA cytosine methyltransferase [Enterococcus larvae]|uniref:DNA cytosine methyltransferase n=1 Tax=Enterococcus larvae TaxID=2794352 RepID=UPI001FD82E99|nr:DNA cytosine methyltransferase [Enterococcus larvae]
MIIDSFAGGGGASQGIEEAIGRSIDVAINHDPDAIAMHEANHPNTKHYCESVYDVDPNEATKGNPVALCWFSPDCKHFSKAKGATPVSKEIRGLAWVAVDWAAKTKSRVILLENVEEFETWGPLEVVRDKKTGRVVTTDTYQVWSESAGKMITKNRIADQGEMTPVNKQMFRPKEEKKGFIFRRFVKALENLGYKVEFKQLKACDYGAPTTRKRLFMIARCDGKPIVWPEPTHAHKDSPEVKNKELLPYRSAAECIDWSIPGKSIFNRKKPLAEATMRRIARGIFKFVLSNTDPFIVTVNHSGPDFRGQEITEPLTTVTGKNGYGLVSPTIMVNTTGHSGSSIDEPLRTVTTGGQQALISPSLIQMGYGDPEGKRVLNLDGPLGTITAGGNKFAVASAWIKEDYGASIGTDINNPLGTITSQSNHHSLMTAFLSKAYGGNYTGAGIDVTDPTATITSVDHHTLISAFISKTYGGQSRSVASSMNEPLHTITARNVHSLCQLKLSKNIENSLQVENFLSKYADDISFGYSKSAFIVKYYGTDDGQPVDEPLHTITTRDRFGLVCIEGVEYQIVDITLRMLEPHELALAQGVPANYIINMDKDGKKISKAKQVARIGNMVVPNCAKALVESNLPELCSHQPFSEQGELLSADFGWSG